MLTHEKRPSSAIDSPRFDFSLRSAERLDGTQSPFFVTPRHDRVIRPFVALLACGQHCSSGTEMLSSTNATLRSNDNLAEIVPQWDLRIRPGTQSSRNLASVCDRPRRLASDETAMGRCAYGDRLASRFGLKSAPVVIMRSLRKSQLAVTEIVNDNPDFGKTLPNSRGGCVSRASDDAGLSRP